MTKRSSETKLFKFHSVYETLCHMIPKVDDLYPVECVNKLKNETTSAKCRLGKSAIATFCDLENSIKPNNRKTLIPSGAVHPLTSYVMNYLLYTGDYKETSEQVF